MERFMVLGLTSIAGAALWTVGDAVNALGPQEKSQG